MFTFSFPGRALATICAVIFVAVVGFLASVPSVRAATYQIDYESDILSLKGEIDIRARGRFDILEFAQQIEDFSIRASAPGLVEFTFTPENALFGARSFTVTSGENVIFDVDAEEIRITAERGGLFDTRNQFLITKEYQGRKKPNLVFATSGLRYYDQNGDYRIDLDFGGTQLLATVPLPGGAALMLPLLVGGGAVVLRRRGRG